MVTDVCVFRAPCVALILFAGVGVVVFSEWRCGVVSCSSETCSRLADGSWLFQVFTPKITLNRLLDCEMAKKGLSEKAKFPRLYVLAPWLLSCAAV